MNEKCWTVDAYHGLPPNLLIDQLYITSHSYIPM